MLELYKNLAGKVMTVCGSIEPEEMGSVMMHEHIHGNCFTDDEEPTPPEQVVLLEKWSKPHLKRLHNFGCHTLVDCTTPPKRGWPDVYQNVTEFSGVHIVKCTGVYREIEIGTYYATDEHRAIWHFARRSSQEELEAFMLDEFENGMHGTGVRPGVIKLGSSDEEFTPTEAKAFRAGAAVWKETGVHITTHCGNRDCPRAHIDLLEKEGVDPRRVVIGHTQVYMVDYPRKTRELFKRGAVFCPTNLRMDGDWDWIKNLVNSIRQLFQEGYGDNIVLGLDSYVGGSEVDPALYGPAEYLPPPPFVYMFDYTLPRFRKLGLEEEAIEQMMVINPKRIVPIQVT